MRCRDVERLCTRYVDGDLDDRVASALRGHLRTCSACRTMVEDEEAVRDAAAGLEPVEPPAALWGAVQERLARAEIADAERSLAWLWWQRLRQHALPAAVAVAAVAVLLVWNSRRNDERADQAPPSADTLAEGAAVEAPGAPRVAPPSMRFLEAREREVLEADATYVGVIGELETAVSETRVAWSKDAARAFDTKLAELEASARQHARSLAVDGFHDPKSRDALYTSYRAQIGLMERTVLEELFE